MPGEHPADGDMNEMALPSRHRIRNSSPGGLMPSTLTFVGGDEQNGRVTTLKLI